MTKYVAMQTHNKYIQLHTVDRLSYTPAGWHRPYAYYSLDNLDKAKRHPAFKRSALVDAPGIVIKANNVRMVDVETCKAIDDIDRQLTELRKQRQSIINDRFLTFPLVQEGDLERSHTQIFNTKQEAEAR